MLKEAWRICEAQVDTVNISCPLCGVTKPVFRWSSSSISCWKNPFVTSSDEKTTAPPIADKVVSCFGNGYALGDGEVGFTVDSVAVKALRLDLGCWESLR